MTASCVRLLVCVKGVVEVVDGSICDLVNPCLGGGFS
jgi:hypothetical protein